MTIRVADQVCVGHFPELQGPVLRAHLHCCLPDSPCTEETGVSADWTGPRVRPRSVWDVPQSPRPHVPMHTHQHAHRHIYTQTREHVCAGPQCTEYSTHTCCSLLTCLPLLSRPPMTTCTGCDVARQGLCPSVLGDIRMNQLLCASDQTRGVYRPCHSHHLRPGAQPPRGGLWLLYHLRGHQDPSQPVQPLPPAPGVWFRRAPQGAWHGQGGAVGEF